MLKVKDRTSRQNLSVQDITFWNNEIIKGLFVECIAYLGMIMINDLEVAMYNKLTKSNKSNASFVRQVKKLNKQGYFDGLVEKVDD